MEELPQSILSEILSRITSEYVHDCKLVCKKWLNHLSHRGTHLMPGLLFSIVSINEQTDVQFYEQNGIQFYYADYDAIKSIKPEEYDYERHTTKVNLPSIIKKTEGHYRNVMVGSCNGLVCFTVGHEGLDDPVYICNPVTREYITLPTIINKTAGFLVNGFGYLPSTKEYKVVRILYPDRGSHPDDTTVGWVQVYTLGSSGGWRNIAATTDSLWEHGTLVNGVLYWRDDKDGKIVAFDLADEVFRVLPPLPCIRPRNEEPYYTLRNLGGYLSWIDLVEGKRVDIWFFRKNKHQARQNNVDDLNYYHGWSWNKEVTIEWEEDAGDYDFYDPFAVTKNSEILLWYKRTNLRCYDPKTRSFTTVVADDTNFSFFHGIPHEHNKASLKDIVGAE